VVLLAGAVGCSSCSGQSQGKVESGTTPSGMEAEPKIQSEPMSEKSILAFAIKAAEAALVPTVDQQPNQSLRFLILTEMAVACMRAGSMTRSIQRPTS
jgi:hypothetical protein